MQKILYISQVFPYPLDGGGKIKTYNTLLTLAKKYQVYAVFISERQPTRKQIRKITTSGIKVKVFYDAKILQTVKSDYQKLFTNYIHGIPHHIFQHTNDCAGKFIAQLIPSYEPDIIHIDHVSLGQYLPKEKKQIWVLESHNVEFDLLFSRFRATSQLSRKLYLLFEACLTFFYERRLTKKFDYVFAISDLDKYRIQKSFGIANISTQPVVYPLVRRRATLRSQFNPRYVLFIGDLNWPPNEEAVQWFSTKIFPLILKQHPEAEFHVVGKYKTELWQQITSKANIFFHGYQANLSLFLKLASIFVLPFHMGGGIRVKVLTALANAIPVVTTRLGIEGLHLVNDRECLVADNAKDFASQINNIWKDRRKAMMFKKAGLLYMKKNHDKMKNQKFLKIYQQITARSQ